MSKKKVSFLESRYLASVSHFSVEFQFWVGGGSSNLAAGGVDVRLVLLRVQRV